jgi:hypothetical protein
MLFKKIIFFLENNVMFFSCSGYNFNAANARSKLHSGAPTFGPNMANMNSMAIERMRGLPNMLSRGIPEHSDTFHLYRLKQRTLQILQKLPKTQQYKSYLLTCKMLYLQWTIQQCQA